MEKYGLFVLLLLMISMLYMKADIVLLMCFFLTIYEQFILVYKIVNIDMIIFLDIFIRFVVDTLVFSRLSPSSNTMNMYVFSRFMAVLLELILLMNNNPVFIILYIVISILNFVIWCYVAIKFEKLTPLILFKFPIFLLNFSGGFHKKFVLTSSNIINKGLYLFALNIVVK